MKRRYSIVVLGSILSLCACQREIPTVEDKAIAGYQVQGKVTDRIGNPIPNVSVRVELTAEHVSTDSIGTREYFLGDSTVLVQAFVLDMSNHVVRILQPGVYASGSFTAVWNGRDTAGTIMPTGVYHVQYYVGGQMKFSYPQLVNNGVVTATDPFGRYTIPPQNLPINGELIPLFLSSDGSFYEFVQVTSNVYFWYLLSSRTKAVYRTVELDRVTQIDVMID